MKEYIKEHLTEFALLAVILISASTLSEGIRRGLSSIDIPDSSSSPGWVPLKSYDDGHAILNSDTGTICYVPKNQAYRDTVCQHLP